MYLKHCFLFMLSTIALIACEKESTNPIHVDSTKMNDSVVFATVLTNPEGNSGSTYLQSIPNLLPNKYNNKNSIQAGFGATPIAFPNGHIYSFPDYMGNSKAEVRRYKREHHQLILEGSLSIPAGAGACNIVELNDQKAYLTCQSINQIIVFNPSTMKKIKQIDLSNFSHTNTNAAPSAMIIRDQYLYIGLSQFNSQWMPEENSVEIALFNVNTDKFVKLIKNNTLGLSVPTRPIDANSIFIDEKGDIYINCIGSFGFNPNYPGGILRIKKGETEIDPTYCIRLDQTKIKGLSTGYCQYLATIYYNGNGELYAYASSSELAPDAMNHPYTAMTNFPVIINLQTKQIERIKDFPVSNPQAFAIGKYKDLIVFGSANEKYNGFYTYNPKLKKVEGPIIQVEGWPCFFYSYTK